MATDEVTYQRVVSPAHERVYRMCHHDFEGLPVREAALRLNWSEKTVRRLLAELEVQAPQLFPILTPRQLEVRDLFNEGHTNAQIALMLKISKGTVCSILQNLRKKGVLPKQFAIPMCSYNEAQDLEIKEKF